MQVHHRRRGFFRLCGRILAAVGIGGHLQRLFVQLLHQPVLQIGQHAIHLAAPDAVVGQPKFLVDQLTRLLGQAFPAFDVQFLVTQKRLVQRQHQQAALERAAHGGEARCRDLLEDCHQEAQRTPLVALAARKVEAVLQILAQLLVKQPLGVVHHEGFGVNPAPREQRRAIGPAGIGLGAAEHHRVEPVPFFQHLLGAVE